MLFPFVVVFIIKALGPSGQYVGLQSGGRVLESHSSRLLDLF